MKKTEPVAAHFEQQVIIPLDHGHFIECNISLGSTIAVGPGPRPKRDVYAVLAQLMNENMILTVEVIKQPAAVASISVTPGPKPP